MIANISFYGMMGKLQSSYPEHHDELVEIMGININWIIHQLSVWQRRDEKSQVELAHVLDPTVHQGGFYSGRSIQTESKPLSSKGV